MFKLPGSLQCSGLFLIPDHSGPRAHGPLAPTVQTFSSCTSRTDVCQCLVVQTLVNNMPKSKPSTSMTHVACE